MSSHADRKSSISSSRGATDKRIAQINLEISESKQKIDKYINGMNNKIERTIAHKLMENESKHVQIVEEKDQQIKHLVEGMDRLRQIEAFQNDEALKETLQECRNNMQRMSNLLDMYRREADKYRVETDIKEKQLLACKEREKKLIKKMWILEENIKDIYSNDFLQKNPPRHHLTQTKTYRSRDRGFSQMKVHQNTSKTIYAEKVSTNQRTEFKKLKDQPLKTFKPSIYDGTNLLQQLNLANNSRYGFDKSNNFQVVKDIINLQVSSLSKELGKSKGPSIYDDLRDSLRQTDRLQAGPNLFSEDRLIGVEEYRLIAVNSLNIMSQIQKIVIERYGELKVFDSQSIKLLNELFSNENTVKMLQIILFSYSAEALREIRKHKDEIIIKHFYSQPSIDHSPEKPVKITRPHKHKIDLAIRKNFKNNFTYRQLERDLIKIDAEK